MKMFNHIVQDTIESLVSTYISMSSLDQPFSGRPRQRARKAISANGRCVGCLGFYAAVGSPLHTQRARVPPLRLPRQETIHGWIKLVPLPQLHLDSYCRRDSQRKERRCLPAVNEFQH